MPPSLSQIQPKHPGAAPAIRTADFNALPFRPTAVVPRRHSLEGGRVRSAWESECMHPPGLTKGG